MKVKHKRVLCLVAVIVLITQFLLLETFNNRQVKLIQEQYIQQLGFFMDSLDVLISDTEKYLVTGDSSSFNNIIRNCDRWDKEIYRVGYTYVIYAKVEAESGNTGKLFQQSAIDTYERVIPELCRGFYGYRKNIIEYEQADISPINSIECSNYITSVVAELNQLYEVMTQTIYGQHGSPLASPENYLNFFYCAGDISTEFQTELIG